MPYKRGDEPVPSFRLVKLLGRGGFGEVWKATAPGGVLAALKIINLTNDQGYKEFRAIRLVKHINHPNLVHTIGFWLKDEDSKLMEEDAGEGSLSGKAQASELIIAMGLGDKNLFDRLKECQLAGGSGIQHEELLDYIEAAAKAVDFLNQPIHDLGAGPVSIQHCDIKPQNILIVGGSAQVCDFGLARVLGDNPATQVGGTAFYTAPEVINGNQPSKYTDQYSLALTFYHLLTGQLPFDSKNPTGAMIAHISGRLDFNKVPDGVQTVLRKATALQPERRFGSCVEMVRELRRVIESTRTTASHATSWSKDNPNLLIEVGHEIVPGYRIVRPIGKGGYGEVWEASAPGGKHVALKVIRNLECPKGLQEFKSLEVIKGVEHNHLLEIHAYWILDRNGEVIPDAMRDRPDAPAPSMLVIASRLAYKNLLDRLKECRKEGLQGIPVDELLHYMAQVASAIDHLNAPQHPHGDQLISIQHRDIKPENILLARDNTVKLADFGLAKVLESTQAIIHGSSAGLTPAYAAPEMVLGTVTSWTDQYSLGITYYHLRTGTMPFEKGVSFQELIQIHLQGRLDFSKLPDGERAVVAKSTAVKPEERYPDCATMVKALQKACGFASNFEFDMPRPPSSGQFEVVRTPVTPTEKPSVPLPPLAPSKPNLPPATTKTAPKASPANVPTELEIVLVEDPVTKTFSSPPKPQQDTDSVLPGQETRPGKEAAAAREKTTVAAEAAPAPKTPLPTPVVDLNASIKPTSFSELDASLKPTSLIDIRAKIAEKEAKKSSAEATPAAGKKSSKAKKWKDKVADKKQKSSGRWLVKGGQLLYASTAGWVVKSGRSATKVAAYVLLGTVTLGGMFGSYQFLVQRNVSAAISANQFPTALARAHWFGVLPTISSELRDKTKWAWLDFAAKEADKQNFADSVREYLTVRDEWKDQREAGSRCAKELPGVIDRWLKHAQARVAKTENSADQLEALENEFTRIAAAAPEAKSQCAESQRQIHTRLGEIWSTDPGYPQVLEKLKAANWPEDERHAVKEKVGADQIERLHHLVGKKNAEVKARADGLVAVFDTQAAKIQDIVKEAQDDSRKQLENSPDLAKAIAVADSEQGVLDEAEVRKALSKKLTGELVRAQQLESTDLEKAAGICQVAQRLAREKKIPFPAEVQVGFKQILDKFLATGIGSVVALVDKLAEGQQGVSAADCANQLEAFKDKLKADDFTELKAIVDVFSPNPDAAKAAWPEIKTRLSTSSRGHQLSQAAVHLVKADAVPVLEVLPAIPVSERQQLEPAFKDKVQKELNRFYAEARAAVTDSAPNFARFKQALTRADEAAKFLSQPPPQEERAVLERLAQLRNGAESPKHAEALVWVEKHADAVSADLVPAFRQALQQVAGENGQKEAVVKTLGVLKRIPNLPRGEASELDKLVASLTKPPEPPPVNKNDLVAQLNAAFNGKPTEKDFRELEAKVPEAERRGISALALAYRSLDAYVQLQGDKDKRTGAERAANLLRLDPPPPQAARLAAALLEAGKEPEFYADAKTTLAELLRRNPAALGPTVETLKAGLQSLIGEHIRREYLKPPAEFDWKSFKDELEDADVGNPLVALARAEYVADNLRPPVAPAEKKKLQEAIDAVRADQIKEKALAHYVKALGMRALQPSAQAAAQEMYQAFAAEGAGYLTGVPTRRAKAADILRRGADPLFSGTASPLGDKLFGKPENATLAYHWLAKARELYELDKKTLPPASAIKLAQAADSLPKPDLALVKAIVTDPALVGTDAAKRSPAFTCLTAHVLKDDKDPARQLQALKDFHQLIPLFDKAPGRVKTTEALSRVLEPGIELGQKLVGGNSPKDQKQILADLNYYFGVVTFRGEPDAAQRKKALKAYERALELVGANDKIRAEYLYRRDTALMQDRGGTLQQFAQDADTGLKLNSDHPGSHWLKAYVTYVRDTRDAKVLKNPVERQKVYEKAIKEFATAIECLKKAKDPEKELDLYYEYRINAIRDMVALRLLSTEQSLQWLKQADADADQAIESEPLSVENAYAMKGYVQEDLAYRGDQRELYATAARFFELTYQKKPAPMYGIALSRVECLAGEAGALPAEPPPLTRLAEAANRLNKILAENKDLKPKDRAEALHWLGRLYALQPESYEQAEKAYTDAIATDTDATRNWVRVSVLASAELALKQAEKAREESNTADVQELVNKAQERAKLLKTYPGTEKEYASIVGKCYELDGDPVKAYAAYDIKKDDLNLSLAMLELLVDEKWASKFAVKTDPRFKPKAVLAEAKRWLDFATKNKLMLGRANGLYALATIGAIQPGDLAQEKKVRETAVDSLRTAVKETALAAKDGWRWRLELAKQLQALAANKDADKEMVAKYKAEGLALLDEIEDRVQGRKKEELPKLRSAFQALGN